MQIKCPKCLEEFHATEVNVLLASLLILLERNQIDEAREEIRKTMPTWDYDPRNSNRK